MWARKWCSTGSITAQVEGTGTVKAKSSETLTLTTPGTVLDVLVAEGDMVTAASPSSPSDLPGGQDRGGVQARSRGGL